MTGAVPPEKPLMVRFFNTVGAMVDGPVTWFREKVVEPNRKVYPWYHQQFRRVPTIDQCYTDDLLCEFEANQQFKRDRLVDNEILIVLRKRFEDCIIYESPDVRSCDALLATYHEAETNWYIKYGELGAYGNAKKAYMKQKHRMLWERRHGPVGTGTKEWREEMAEKAKKQEE